MSRIRVSHDGGASLLIVLVFMLLLSVISLGLLSYSDISFQAHVSIRETRQENYAADAALELGIQKVAEDSTGLLGSPGVDCPTFTLSGASGTSEATVTCEADGGAGGPAGGRPANAILTLSTTMPLSAAGTQTLSVQGNVYSHNDITTSTSAGSKLDVSGRAQANGPGCLSPKVTASLGKTCTGGGEDSIGADPLWLSRAVVSSPAPLPLCSVLGHPLATFSPGTYTVSPTTLLTAPSCANRQTLLFLPGVYSFQNVTFDTAKFSVVVGTPGPWSAATLAPPSDGSACLVGGPGAQFVMGGTSKLTVPNEATTVTFCAGPDTNTADSSPAIALWGRGASATGLSTENKPNVFVYGSIYMPNASADLTLHNRARTYYRGALVLSSLTASVSASSTQADSPISLPPCTATDPCQTDRRVIFTSSVGSEPWIRSVVDFDDAGGTQPARDYTIDSWSVLR